MRRILISVGKMGKSGIPFRYRHRLAHSLYHAALKCPRRAPVPDPDWRRAGPEGMRSDAIGERRGSGQ